MTIGNSIPELKKTRDALHKVVVSVRRLEDDLSEHIREVDSYLKYWKDACRQRLILISIIKKLKLEINYNDYGGNIVSSAPACISLAQADLLHKIHSEVADSADQEEKA